MKHTLILFFIALSTSSLAQTAHLSGLVVDENKSPLPGATIRLQPGKLAMQSNRIGRFSFTDLAEETYTLIVSYVGYETQNISLTLPLKEHELSIVLKPALQQLDVAVIEGDRLALRKQEEALNIEVVGRSFIQRNLGGSLMKSMERLPGISTIGIGSGQSKPLIRGLGFNRVVVMDKGVKHEGQQWGADHGLEIDQFAADEVELIKGAASFAFGSDAIGGAINIKPAPTPGKNEVGGSVNIIGKSNNSLYGTSVNLFGRKEAWFFDARFTHQDYGDYRTPTDRVYVYDYAVNLDENYLRNTAGRETSLHLNTGYIHDRFRSTFYLSNIHSKSGFFANAHGLEPRRVDTDQHDRSNRDMLLPNQQVNHLKLINRSEYQFQGHRLAMELGYQRNYRQEFSQYVNHGYMPPVYPEALSIPADLERAFDKHVYSLNLRDELILGRHELTTGTNVEQQSNKIGGWGFLVPSFRQTTAGAFVYDKLRLSNLVLLHGAVRYDYGHISIDPYVDWFTSEVTTDRGPISERLPRANSLSRTFNSFVWSAGINYNRNRWMLKGNIGKSFRMPIAKELSANGVNYHYFSYERGDPELSPEQSYQADLSMTWKEKKWSVQLSPFYNYFPNYIYLNPTAEHDYYYGAGNQVFEYTQSKVVRFGGEIQLEYQLLKSLRAQLLGEYVHARQRSGQKLGYTLPFSPPPSALLNLSWSPELGERLQDSYFSLDYRITAAQNRIVPPEKKTPGYQVFHVQAGTTIHIYHQPVTFSLQVQNLLNTRYLEHTSFYRLIELPEAGRNIILSLKIPVTFKKTT
ncbi:TonB-dependent receptor [Cesiribacter sp. SM1]|uniref:TonB-dependent receptor n=1 Tax=Cesiribacter sp. SM1 TaxID=2861196 RepID=UPI001CD746D9|nr:TonB-dependent receptor [Cesiribacter sp. SM1]